MGAGFDATRPAIVASTGISMYLIEDAIAATVRRVASLVPSSTLVMSLLLPIELADPEVRLGIGRAAEGGRANGTPFLSFFTSTEILALAHEAGYRECPGRVSGSPCRALLHRQDGWPSSTEQLGGVAGCDDLTPA